jgi:hypothetical protein
MHPAKAGMLISFGNFYAKDPSDSRNIKGKNLDQVSRLAFDPYKKSQ